MKRSLAKLVERQSTLHKAYAVMIVLGVTVAVFGLILVAQLPSPWTTIVAVLVGGAISFLASMIVQSFASKEQTEMIKAVTLDAEGILPLPDAFRRLKWLAYATKRAAPQGSKITEWRMTPLRKSDSSGSRFVTYLLDATNLVGEMVTYAATFVGLQGCALAAITRENETSSSVIFDTALPDAGVFFGAAYLTDWGSERDLTLAIIGTSEPPMLDSMSQDILAAFEQWYKRIDWTVEDAYMAHPSRMKNSEVEPGASSGHGETPGPKS